MQKRRTPEQIRVDALKMAVKKAESGCPMCAEKYFELARQNGATEQDIQDVLEQATGMIKQGLNRRELIKYAVASGLAITTTTGLLFQETPTPAMAASYYYGVDSNTTNCCGMPLNFYIGRMGFGTSPDTSYFAFNTSMASQVGLKNTFGYWGVQGPTASSGSAYNWGVAQANAAWNAWSGTFVGCDYIGGLTVFGDLESGFGGWGSNRGNNQEVVTGFLDELFDITPSGVWPALYVSPSFWNAYLGSGTILPTNSGWVLWVTGSYECYVCGPCDASCTTTPGDAASYFANNVSSVVLGGQHPVVWQYWLTDPGCDNSGCGDWNISSQLAATLVPTN